eukprot:6117491-Ditylum_brightwellii.AAC.1
MDQRVAMGFFTELIVITVAVVATAAMIAAITAFRPFSWLLMHGSAPCTAPPQKLMPICQFFSSLALIYLHLPRQHHHCTFQNVF